MTSGIKALKEAGRLLRSLLWLNGTMRTWQGLTRSINFLEVTIIHTYPKVVTGNYFTTVMREIALVSRYIILQKG